MVRRGISDVVGIIANDAIPKEEGCGGVGN
jgi:hypothetical protein